MRLASGPLWIVPCALTLDAAIGDPDWLWRRFPHPVTAFGILVKRPDDRLDDPLLPYPMRKLRGVVAAAVLMAVAIGAGILVEKLLRLAPAGDLFVALTASIFIAQRSLYQHVAAVIHALRQTVQQGRGAVAKIVGRDCDDLDESGVSRAAIESIVRFDFKPTTS